jgi:hypothetical protein
MPSNRAIFAGEGSAAVLPMVAAEVRADLVAFPLPSPAGILLAPAAYHEIYRLAYERARAAARPSRYEMAMRICRN